MILKLIELEYPLDEVVYFNIGAEFKAIEKNRNRVKELLESKNILFTELKPKQDFFYTMLEKPVIKRNGEKQSGYKWCGGLCRWGTSLKLNAINENNKKYGNEFIVEYVGVAVDEQKRLLRERVKRCSNRLKLYPLAEWGMKEKDCLEYCYSKGYDWEENGKDLYQILDRVSCWCCRNKNLKELERMFLFLPEYWEKLKDLQHKIDIPFRDNVTIDDLEQRFKVNNRLFMGSGSSDVACVNTNRDFIGIKPNKNYFDIAKKRIENGSVQEEINKNVIDDFLLF